MAAFLAALGTRAACVVLLSTDGQLGLVLPRPEVLSELVTLVAAALVAAGLSACFDSAAKTLPSGPSV